jgi:hypothetical protein
MSLPVLLLPFVSANPGEFCAHVIFNDSSSLREPSAEFGGGFFVSPFCEVHT